MTEPADIADYINSLCIDMKGMAARSNLLLLCYLLDLCALEASMIVKQEKARKRALKKQSAVARASLAATETELTTA
jgi:hypothetical protein